MTREIKYVQDGQVLKLRKLSDSEVNSLKREYTSELAKKFFNRRKNCYWEDEFGGVIYINKLSIFHKKFPENTNE